MPFHADCTKEPDREEKKNQRPTKEAPKGHFPLTSRQLMLVNPLVNQKYSNSKQLACTHESSLGSALLPQLYNHATFHS